MSASGGDGGDDLEAELGRGRDLAGVEGQVGGGAGKAIGGPARWMASTSRRP